MPTKNQTKEFIGKVRQRHDDRLEENTATPAKAGMMSAADKVKLNAIRFDFESGTLSVVTDNQTLTFTANTGGGSLVTPTAFTIPTSAWTLDSNETSEFVYYADISVTGLTANDYAEVNFNRASQSIVADANICPSGETLAGIIRLFAENIPESAITGEYVITKGAS